MKPRSGVAAGSFASDAAFARLKQLIIERTGHFYYQDKDTLLWERLRRRFRAAGAPDSAAYLRHLSDPAAGEAEWAALEAEITIGETFFFRGTAVRHRPRHDERLDVRRHVMAAHDACRLAQVGEPSVRARSDERNVHFHAGNRLTGPQPHVVERVGDRLFVAASAVR